MKIEDIDWDDVETGEFSELYETDESEISFSDLAFFDDFLDMDTDEYLDHLECDHVKS